MDKIILAKATALKAGDIVKKFPISLATEDMFDDKRGSDTETYLVKSVNAGNGMLSLCMTGDSLAIFAAPGDVCRKTISPAELVEENRWWI